MSFFCCGRSDRTKFSEKIQIGPILNNSEHGNFRYVTDYWFFDRGNVFRNIVVMISRAQEYVKRGRLLVIYEPERLRQVWLIFVGRSR